MKLCSINFGTHQILSKQSPKRVGEKLTHLFHSLKVLSTLKKQNKKTCSNLG